MAKLRPKRRRNVRSSRDSGVPLALKKINPDPPTIAMTMKRTINVQQTDTSVDGAASLTSAGLKALIDNQCYAGTSPFYRYVINSIKVWGQAGSPTSISLSETKYGIVTSDVGSYSNRPTGGIYFPPSTRDVRSSDSVGTIASLTTNPDAADFVVVYNVTLWTVASADF